MDGEIAGSKRESCLQFVNFKFERYKKIIDDDQQACEQNIAAIRELVMLCNYDDDRLRSITGYGTVELANQLDYLQREALKTYEENKTCLFKLFQKLLKLHREFAYDKVSLNERRIAELFQYRPSLLPNIEKLNRSKPASLPPASLPSTASNVNSHRLVFAATPTPKSASFTSFSKRVEIETFQPKSEPLAQNLPAPIESNEIDLTKLIRETHPSDTASQFKFSRLSQNWLRQQQNATPVPTKKTAKPTRPCSDALLAAANKRFVLLHNMNISSVLYVFDMQNQETKEYHWDEGEIHSLGHADNNLFYIITSTKLFLYDIIKELIDKQYFLYNTLYKDLLLLTDDPSYRTALKRNNQIQSMAFDDFCYYLYTNKEYDQLLIQCSIETFQQESSVNLTERFADVQYFLGFTVTSKSLVTFLVADTRNHYLLFCDGSRDYNLIKKLPIPDAVDPRQVVTAFLPQLVVEPSATQRGKPVKAGKQLWFVLDRGGNCVHCLVHERYLTQIGSAASQPIEALALFDNKLILAFNELSVEIIDLDNYFSPLKL